MMISDTPEMIFRTEMAIRSIKRFSNNNEVAFSIVVNGEQKIFPKNIIKNQERIKSKYLLNNAEIYECPCYWSIPFPSRWFIEPKMENCVFIDVDMIACKDLTPLYNLEKQVVHGVKAGKQAMTDEEWESIGFNKKDLDFYFNFGLVVVPSEHIEKIKKMMLVNVLKISNKFKEHYYFAGQIALAYSLKELGLQMNSLPNKFNWYDFWAFDKNYEKEILFLHYLSNRDGAVNLKKISNTANNNSVQLIKKTCKKLIKL